MLDANDGVERAREWLVLPLPVEVWRRLAAQAASADRQPWQQARWLLLRALDAEPETTDDDPFDAAQGERAAATERAS